MTSPTSRRGSRAPATPFGPLSTVRYTVNGVNFDMVRVPPGRLVDGEGPSRHELLVSRPFELGVAPVTQALWDAVMGSSGSYHRGEDRPVEQISWFDTEQLMIELAKHGLPSFRLPTEAEWAWATRCGVPTRWAGAERPKATAVIESTQTVAVEGLPGSAVGAFDLSGGVWEWVADWYGQLPSAGVDVHGPASGWNRVNRGGTWSSVPRAARLANRSGVSPDFRYSILGLRLLRICP